VEPVTDIQRIVMPKWGLSMQSGKVVQWLVAEGDTVSRGDELLEIETEKSAGPVEAIQDGLLRRIVAQPGEEIPVGGTLALLAPSDVPDADIDAASAEARAQIAAGVVDDVGGPMVVTVEVGGRTLSSTVVGDGDDVVVLVHGYGGDKGSWQFVQEPVATGRRVYALDLPGHGASSKDVGDGSLDLLAGAVLGFLDELAIERAHLVGHSLGGAVVVTAAAAAPDRIPSLTLLAPAGFGSPPDAEYLRGFQAAESRRDLKPLLGRLFADDKYVTRQLVEDLLRSKRIDGVAPALETLLGTLLDGDAQAIDCITVLRSLDVPTVILWGSDDRILPVPEAATVEAVATLRLVPGAGHMAHVEQPDAVVKAIEEAIGAA
jgi:pyruvate dehydrogenase E2 component (dihydrolipoamide acetyltransferase)